MLQDSFLLPSLTLPLFWPFRDDFSVFLFFVYRENRMQNNRGLVLGLILASQSLFNIYGVQAQPSPASQKRISAAIAAAASQSHPDYTAFVNPFIGTGNVTTVYLLCQLLTLILEDNFGDVW